MYSGPELALGNVYSLIIPVDGKNTKILFPLNSVPKTAVEPETVVVTKPTGFEPAVGIGHSWNVLVEGSKWTILLPDNSTNQQQFPDGSNANAVGVLPGVGIAHSDSVAVVAAKTGLVAIKEGKSRINDNTTIVLPKTFSFFTA